MKGIQTAFLVQELRQFWCMGGFLPIGGASAVEGLQSIGLPHLAYIVSKKFLISPFLHILKCQKLVWYTLTWMSRSIVQQKLFVLQLFGLVTKKSSTLFS